MLWLRRHSQLLTSVVSCSVQAKQAALLAGATQGKRTKLVNDIRTEPCTAIAQASDQIWLFVNDEVAETAAHTNRNATRFI
jgi:hypothetical protein